MPTSLNRIAATLFVTLISGLLVAAETETRKFQFTPGKAEIGYTRVAEPSPYTKERGFGFEPGSTPQIAACDGKAPLQSGYVTADKPFYFSVAVPPGNYRVTLTLGDSGGESTVTVKSELRRLMLERVSSQRGEFVTKSCVVNVRTPSIAGGAQVRLKAPRETVDEVWNWDDRLTLEFNDRRPCLAALVIEPVTVPTVYLLGDSTVCDQPHEPYASWGQMLPRFFNPTVAIANHAESGESLRSSAAAGRLQKVLGEIRAGDYVLIQFGHNDMKATEPNASATYQSTLREWVKKIQERRGTPILVTPMHRHRFADEKVVNTLRDYPDKVREVANEMKIPLVDLNALSKSLYESFGPKEAVALFKHDRPGDPKFDGTHHSPFGAYELAKCVVVGLQQAKVELAKHVVADFGMFDPAHPDAADKFAVPASPGRQP